ncbi:hypothetical protein P154DRAFT_106180 [Amniculicola lignicola CBS 123094]|uniref:Serine hydrolase domain-containing protein n=1 Tax=Amniculicola lignicola CBS 123094 TaxID=1392246 RepID=A0A6A5W5X1_9PLEO|nr:hypothetical protein P154DRAFT_106180 [Amniculicola lignicola CBS 123094]
MPVRVLCLHGQGVNSAVFQKQTESLRAMLPVDYEFHFFDGKYECESAEEVRDHYPPPYLTWYNTPTVEKVKDAHEQIRQIIKTHGPFDAVMGFSQGAAVAASLLLHEELESTPLSFKAAIFIGSPIPFAKAAQVGIDARAYFGIRNTLPNAHARPNRIPPHLVTDPAYLRNPAQLERASCDDVQYQMFHPTVDEVRIRLPTGHVMGMQDKWFCHSKDLVGLCQENSKVVLQHHGGHEVPRAYTEEICDVVETVFGGLL